jgi:hypothetical protein
MYFSSNNLAVTSLHSELEVVGSIGHQAGTHSHDASDGLEKLSNVASR